MYLILLPNNNIGYDNIFINNLMNINIYLMSQSYYINLIKYPIIFIIYLYVVLIESGRIPVDLIEAESELISGYSIEYSGFLYALFASAEYSIILFHSFLLSIIFLSYSSFYLTYIYITVFFLIFIIIRSTLPRVVYTHIISFSFHYILPISLIFLLYTFITIYSTYVSISFSLFFSPYHHKDIISWLLCYV